MPLVVLLALSVSLLLPETLGSPNRISAQIEQKPISKEVGIPSYRAKSQGDWQQLATNGYPGTFFSSEPFPKPEHAEEESKLNREQPEQNVNMGDEVLNVIEVEASIRNAAIENVPVDMQELGQLKEYYAGNNNLFELQRFVESLPDSYEMKVPILEDLALFFFEHGQVADSNSLVESIQDHNDNIRIKYIKADIYWWSGDPTRAVDTLLAATQIAVEPYQYERLSQIVASTGDEVGASYYMELADALKSSLHHDQ